MKEYLKATFKDLVKLVAPHKETVFAAVSLLALLSQFSTVNYYIARHAAPQNIVNINSNDASRGIRTAINTTWFTGNHFYPYGNVYFRLTHTFNDLAPKTFPLEDIAADEKEEKSNHYSLMIVSLLSVYALAFLLAGHFAGSLPLRLVFTYILTSAFLQSSVWADFILVPHPDMTLAFMLAAAAALSCKLIRFPQNKFYFNASAAMWGFATATKFSTILFYPSLLVLFLLPNAHSLKGRIKRLLHYVMVMFLSYQVIGFPQNLMIHKHIAFLLRQSHHSVSPDWNSFTEWFSLGWEQIAWPGLVVLIFAVVFRKRKEGFPTKQAFLFFAIPLLVLFSRKITSFHEHYPIPFVSFSLVGMAALTGQLNLSRFFKAKIKGTMVFILSAFALFFLNPMMQKNLAKSAQRNSICFHQAAKAASVIRNKQNEGLLVQVDPYFPLGDRNKAHIRKWGYTLNDLSNEDVKVIGIRTKFYSRYLSPAPQHRRESEKAVWKDKGDFYKLFHDQKSVNYRGQEWQRVYSDKCGHHIFERTL